MARLPVPGRDDDAWGMLLNEFLSVAHHPDGSLKAAVAAFPSNHMFSVTDYGAVYGTSVSAAQMAANLQAIAQARDAAIAAGGGTILIGAPLVVSGTVDLTGVNSVARIALVGLGALEGSAAIIYGGSSPISALVDLTGTCECVVSGLTLDGGGKARYALKCARDAQGHQAGKHYFERLFLVNATIAAHLNYASEENTYLKCQFQASPIGCIVSGFPIDEAHVTRPGATPCTTYANTPFPGSWQSSTNHHFYDCAFGSTFGSMPSGSTRCGLLVQGSAVKLFGGVVQTVSGAEAGLILDDTHQRACLYGVDFDSGLPNICLKMGAYAPPDVYHLNRVDIRGGHWTMNPSSGTAYIDARNLKASCIGGLTLMGRAPAAGYGIVLRDGCAANIFDNCCYGDGTGVSINELGPNASGNLAFSDGQLAFLGGSTGLPATTLSNAATTLNGLTVQGTAVSTTPPGANVLQHARTGDGFTSFAISQLGAFTWGSGKAPLDTNLYRREAGVLGTDSQLVASSHGLVTKAKAGPPSDADLASAQDGAIIVDSANNRLWVRVGGAWKYAALT